MINIFEVTTAHGEITLTITEDLDKALSDEVLRGACNVLQITIWRDGIEVFNSKPYKENEINYDDIYVDIMRYLSTQI